MTSAKERRPHSAAADDAGPWIEPEEAEARLLLVVDGRVEPDDPQLAAALASGNLAALVLWAGDLPAGALDGFRYACGQASVAFLIAGSARDALAARADGVHLRSEAEVAEARRLMGRDALIGAACGRSRHAAMVAGEAGADYVLFGKVGDPHGLDELAELACWWSELFVIPCIAAGRIGLKAVVELVAAGADSLALDLAGLAAAGGIDPVAEALRAGTELRRRNLPVSP